MSSSLDSWVKDQITSLYQTQETPAATTNDVAVVDNLFASSPKITVNGETKSVAEYKDDVSARTSAAADATVKWNSVDTTQNPVVSGSFTIERQMKYRIRAAPARNKLHVEFTAKVEEPKEGSSQFGKLLELSETTKSEAEPVHLGGTTENKLD
ncbi:hypothetical protein DL96DRAFT_1713435 [Flagelloscypha sp. PMI_526]|nr:hypothetical protein DL96DRAFT_1713435 [Flagelloscypha sp. PMI_526]